MPRPADNSIVNVVIHTKPNKIWVFCDGQIHSARWRTSDNGDCLRNVVGNAGLLNAAMLMWDGKEAFSTTFLELEAWSQGWGAWSD